MDVGTGFYVEKDIKSAAQFYENKTNELAASIKDLEAIIQGKNNNTRMLDEGTGQPSWQKFLGLTHETNGCTLNSPQAKDGGASATGGVVIESPRH